MKMRNALVLAITIAVTTACAQAQEADGSVTFMDNFGQSITISRFGTVLRFKDSKGQENATENYFRIGPYGNTGPFPWIDSRKAGEASAVLRIAFPKSGATLEKGQVMEVTATVSQGGLTVTRRLTWPAGSSAVNIDETISAPGASIVGTLEEGIVGNLKLHPPCPGPQGEGNCPPETPTAFRIMSKQLPDFPGRPPRVLVTTELTGQLPISRGKPVHIYFTIGPYGNIPSSRQ